MDTNTARMYIKSSKFGRLYCNQTSIYIYIYIYVALRLRNVPKLDGQQKQEKALMPIPGKPIQAFESISTAYSKLTL